MIAYGLKKLARQNGMSIASGVAYGSFKGFAAAFSEGSGYKRIDISSRFPDELSRDELFAQLQQRDLKKEFRILQLVVSDTSGCCITVIFHDTIGTMKRITTFLDYFLPLLSQYGAAGADICPECGGELYGGGSWKLINGSAYHLHESCAASITASAEAQEQAEREADTGSIGAGIVGAVLGALVGAIPWAILLYLGYFAAIVGLFIGWLSKKGYELLHGKHCKAKLFIVIIASILGVFVGNFAADFFSLFGLIRDGLLPELTYGDIFPALLYLLSTDDSYMTTTITNLFLGLFFALLGLLGLIKDINSETRGLKIKELK